MTSVFIGAGDDDADVAWLPDPSSGRSRERITLKLSDLVRTSSSLPRLVQIVNSGDERDCGDFGPICSPAVDLNRPVLLYHDYRAVRVTARSLRPGAGGELEIQGPSIVIPDSYRGWFAVVTTGGRSAPCYDTLSEVVSARLTVFLTRHDIPAYVQLKNGVPVKRDTSRQEAPGVSRNYRRNVVDSLSTAYCRCSVPSGSVLRVLSVFRDINTTISGSSQDKPASSTDYVQCVNYKNEVLFVPVEVRGRFFAAAPGAGVRPDWRHVCQLSQLLRHRALPVTVRLVCGYAPRHAQNFTGLLRLESASHQHLVLGCSTAAPPTPPTPTATSEATTTSTLSAELALFELDVGPTSSVSSQLQLLPLDHRCPLMAPPFARAADMCRRHGAAWKRQMRVAYGLYAEDGPRPAGRLGNSSVHEKIVWRIPADSETNRACSQESGPSSMFLYRAPVEPEVDYDQGELKQAASGSNLGRNRRNTGWQVVHIGSEKTPPVAESSTANTRDCLARVGRSDAIGKKSKSPMSDSSISQQRADPITKVERRVPDPLRRGPLSLQTSIVPASRKAELPTKPAAASPVYALSNRPVRSLSAHNIPLRRRLAKTVSLETDGGGQGWRHAVTAFLSGRQVRGRRSRGNADVTSSFIFKRPDNMNASDHWKHHREPRQLEDVEQKEDQIGGVHKDTTSAVTVPETTDASASLAENIYAEIGEDFRVNQISSSINKIRIAGSKLSANGEGPVLEEQHAKLSTPFQRRFLTRRSSYGGSARVDYTRGDGVKGATSNATGALEDTLKLGSDGHSSCTSSPADTLEQCGR